LTPANRQGLPDGEKAAEWQRRFAPAEMVTFVRLSGPMEHLAWLWFAAPKRLKKFRGSRPLAGEMLVPAADCRVE
jgi:hypothetical protein